MSSLALIDEGNGYGRPQILKFAKIDVGYLGGFSTRSGDSVYRSW